jgi:branched-chain amino acid aminotransferase
MLAVRHNCAVTRRVGHGRAEFTEGTPMAEHPKYLWSNGEQKKWEDATVHITQIGWSSVGAVFEGIRGYWNDEREELYVFRLREHMDRFMRSMKLMRMEPKWNRDELIEACLTLARENECRQDTYIRPLAYFGSSSRGAFRGGGDTDILITTNPNPSHLTTGMTQTAGVSSYRRIHEDVMPPRVKNLSNYRNSQLASTEARLNGYDTAVILNPSGHVTEGPGACLFFVRDNVVVTPDLTSGILESITRDAFIILCRESLGLEVQERIVDRTELYVADEVFFAGTAAEVSPVVMIDHHQIGSGEIGPVTKRLDSLFNDVVRGKTDAYDAWRTPVGLRTLATAAGDGD